MVSETTHYKLLFERRIQLEHKVADNEARISRLDAMLRELQSTRTQFEEEARVSSSNATILLTEFILRQASAQIINQELKLILAKRDADLTRLRDQREQLNAELNELRSRENIKYQSSRELKALAESRSVRQSHTDSY
jgi:E3 ubiquitin-protein ligase BRE1